MSSPLVEMIAGILNQALPAAGITEAATLTKSTPGTRTVGSPTGGTNPTTTTYPCKGFVSTEKRDSIEGTLVQKTDKVVCLIGLGSTRPAKGDRIAIDSQTLTVLGVEGTIAIWTCLCRA